MNNANAQRDLLKAVSRSFYLSLRFLPPSMRDAASIAYLLARTSDTLADSVSLNCSLRLESLDLFQQQIKGSMKPAEWSASILSAIPLLEEKRLLTHQSTLFEELRRLDFSQQGLIIELLDVILSGQRFDLQHFVNATSSNIISLADDRALNNYTWKVAGSVGVFWTKLGFLTLGERFSSHPAESFMELAAQYGSGLQLINILKDLTHDLQMGRCYLPVTDPKDLDALFAEYLKWHAIAHQRIQAGHSYSLKLSLKRLRIATSLPALIGRITLENLPKNRQIFLQKPSRIPRWKIYSIILRQFLPH